MHTSVGTPSSDGQLLTLAGLYFTHYTKQSDRRAQPCAGRNFPNSSVNYTSRDRMKIPRGPPIPDSMNPELSSSQIRCAQITYL